jgi:mono/diheme cytochrome c family protein
MRMAGFFATLAAASAWAAAAALPAQGGNRYDAASNFAIHCMGCHRSDGRGSPPEVPALAPDLQWMLRSKAGREYVLRVPGVAGSSLSDSQTTAVLNWIIATLLPPAQATTITPFTDAEVTASRHRPLLDVRTERARLMAQRP